MGPLLFPTVFWCDAPEAGLIGAVSLFKFRRIKHLVVATIILDYPWSLLRGTEGSNPSPSSGESRANLSLAGIRLPTSRSRGFPRVCGSGRAARSAETRRTRQHRAYGR